MDAIGSILTIKLNSNFRHVSYVIIYPEMCLDCIKQTCCDTVTISANDLEKIAGVHETTKKFLAKRKTIIECLQTIMGIVIITSITLLVLVIVATSIALSNTSNGLELAIVGGIGIFSIIFLVISLVINYIIYHFIKLWHNIWHDYKNSIVYSKYLAIIIYIVGPLVGLLAFASNTASQTAGLIKLTSTVVMIISTIHTFILKSNTYIREISDSHEYKVISRILKLVYIPLAVIILGIICIASVDVLFILFTISYIVMLSISIIIDNPINEKIESISSITCIILIITMGIISNPGTIAFMLSAYAYYVINSVIVVDLVNEWIMKNRTGAQGTNESIAILMRDTGFSNITDSIGLISREDKKDNDSAATV